MPKAVQYSLIFVNNSSQTGDACVYQHDPDTDDPSIMSLAWFSKAAAPTTRLRFDWNIDYSFVWSQTGQLRPGVQFTASQNWAADLSEENEVQFTNTGGAYTFQNQKKGPQNGSMYIRQDGTIAANQVAVGIGMSGSGTFVVQGQPNVSAIFTPHPKYWITFGSFLEGEVLDISTITNPAEIAFPPNVYSMTAILGQDNLWTIRQTSAVNAAFLAAQATDPHSDWGSLKAS